MKRVILVRATDGTIGSVVTVGFAADSAVLKQINEALNEQPIGSRGMWNFPDAEDSGFTVEVA